LKAAGIEYERGDMTHLVWEQSWGIFLLVTVAIGGGTAYMTGRAVAHGWDAKWKLMVYIVLLAFAVRFLHYSLFEGTLLSLHYYLVDLVVLLAIGYVAFVITRSGQMATQYRFRFERAGPFGWRQKQPGDL